MTIHRVEFRNVEAVVEREVKDGRIIGLKKWDGRIVKVVIPKEQPAEYDENED